MHFMSYIKQNFLVVERSHTNKPALPCFAMAAYLLTSLQPEQHFLLFLISCTCKCLTFPALMCECVCVLSSWSKYSSISTAFLQRLFPKKEPLITFARDKDWAGFSWWLGCFYWVHWGFKNKKSSSRSEHPSLLITVVITTFVYTRKIHRHSLLMSFFKLLSCNPCCREKPYHFYRVMPFMTFIKGHWKINII